LVYTNGPAIGMPGPPVLVAVATNISPSQFATTQTVTIAANTGSNIYELVCAGWYSNSVVVSLTNSTGQSASLVTNCFWTSPNGTFANAYGEMAFYVFPSPPSASHTVTITWASPLSTGGLLNVLSFMNCSGWTGTCPTNYAPLHVQGTLSNVVSSASNELIVGFDVLDYDAFHATITDNPITLGGGGVVVAGEQWDVHVYGQYVWTNAGAVFVTNTSYYATDDGPHGMTVIRLKGF
jgi:hypothetical protein